MAPATARPGPDDDRGQDARQAQLQDDRLGRGGPGPLDREAERAEEDPDRVAGRDGDAPGGDAEDDDRGQGGEADEGEGGRARRSGGPSETDPREGERPAADRHGRSVTAPGSADGAGGSGAGRVDRERQGAQPLDEARARARHDDVVRRAGSRRPCTAVIAAPAGARRDDLGRRPVGGVAEDDDLGVGREERLERDREDGRAAGRDRVAAGERDHLGDEGVVGRAVDLLRGVELVEDARAASRRRRRSPPRSRRSRPASAPPAPRRPPAPRPPSRRARCPSSTVGHVGRVDDEHRDPEAAELRERVRAVEAVAAGHDEVGLEADDLLDVDALEGGDVGQVDRLGRVVVEVGRARRRAAPAPTAKRISVVAGVSETIRSGRAGIVTAVPSSSVRVSGNAGAGVGAGVGGGGRGRGRGAAVGRAPAVGAAAGAAGGQERRPAGRRPRSDGRRGRRGTG